MLSEQFAGNTYQLRILVTENGTVNFFLDKNKESLQENNLQQDECDFLKEELQFAIEEFLPSIVIQYTGGGPCCDLSQLTPFTVKQENVSPCCGVTILMPQKECSQCNRKVDC